MKNLFIERPATKSSLSRRKSVCGVGINDADYVVSTKGCGKVIQCPYYTSWHNMIKRCYEKPSKAYFGCSVCDEWLLFSNYKEWMKSQDWAGKSCDKDIIKPDNKVYSPEFCVFVSREINNIIMDNKASRGSYPKGVCWDKKSRKFESSMTVDNKKVFLGYFFTPESASKMYRLSKRQHLLSVASTQSDKRVADGLKRHADLLRCQA